jgi:hypothetical protein
VLFIVNYEPANMSLIAGSKMGSSNGLLTKNTAQTELSNLSWKCMMQQQMLHSQLRMAISRAQRKSNSESCNPWASKGSPST